MLHLWKRALRDGRVTLSGEALWQEPQFYRGMPEVRPDRCDGCGQCADCCPAGAIAVEGKAGEAGWRLNAAACHQCSLCEERCPRGAIGHGREDLLAAVRKEDLMQGSGGAEPLLASGEGDREELGRELDRRIRQVCGRSLHIRHLDAGSCNACDSELTALLNPVYDLQRFGIDFVASPRHADVIMATGPVSRHLELAALKTYKAVPDPRIVIAVGACACGGGIHQAEPWSKKGVDGLLPVHVYIPGCPPRPQALLHGLLLAVGRMEELELVKRVRGK